GRGLQGISIGVLPLSISILHQVVDEKRLHGAIALASGMVAAGSVVGMPFGAAITVALGLPAMFLSCGLIGVVCAVWLWVTIPKMGSHASSRRFDVVGAAGIAIGSTALIIALAQG